LSGQAGCVDGVRARALLIRAREGEPGSVLSNLKRQMRLDDHLAKTLPGLAQRIVQRLLALTLGMLINLLTGRAARALVAYDGR
jgi:hypothetical protein